jgi:hypothetical protein
MRLRAVGFTDIDYVEWEMCWEILMTLPQTREMQIISHPLK